VRGEHKNGDEYRKQMRVIIRVSIEKVAPQERQENLIAHALLASCCARIRQK
jgi:hypothetical protein